MNGCEQSVSRIGVCRAGRKSVVGTEQSRRVPVNLWFKVCGWWQELFQVWKLQEYLGADFSIAIMTLDFTNTSKLAMNKALIRWPTINMNMLQSELNAWLLKPWLRKSKCSECHHSHVSSLNYVEVTISTFKGFFLAIDLHISFQQCPWTLKWRVIFVILKKIDMVQGITNTYNNFLKRFIGVPFTRIGQQIWITLRRNNLLDDTWDSSIEVVPTILSSFVCLGNLLGTAESDWWSWQWVTLLG